MEFVATFLQMVVPVPYRKIGSTWPRPDKNYRVYQCLDPDPDWIKIQWGPWTRFRIQEGKK
jgi:hypothetical protein